MNNLLARQYKPDYRPAVDTLMIAYIIYSYCADYWPSISFNSANPTRKARPGSLVLSTKECPAVTLLFRVHASPKFLGIFSVIVVSGVDMKVDLRQGLLDVHRHHLIRYRLTDFETILQNSTERERVGKQNRLCGTRIYATGLRMYA